MTVALGCRVCGETRTIKAHILPRALAHDAKGDGKHVVAVSRDWAGTRYKQSGLWDDAILCEIHERSLHGLDDYGIEFIRRRGDAHPVGRGLFTLSNPEPDKLVGFAACVLWRYAVSRYGGSIALGPWEARLRQYLFECGSEKPAALWVSLSRLHLNGNALTGLIVMPAVERWSGQWVYTFMVSDLRFHLLLDRRTRRTNESIFQADKDPALLIESDARDVRSVPGIYDLALLARRAVR